MRIALAGNPNSGKTTLYNALTGKMEKVGNWAGVTVAKRESPIKKSFANDVTVVDLPGAYSMSPFTSEENITSDFVKTQNPDAIINIVDATNISRSLFFTTQLLELGVPVVVALNKSDINKKKGTVIDAKKLSQKLGCPVVMTVSTDANDAGLKEVVKQAIAVVGKGQVAPFSIEATQTDAKSVVAADERRFALVKEMVTLVEKRKTTTAQRNIQDKVDAVVAHKWLGIPIFMAVMWAVFDISQTTVGPMIADWLCGYIDAFGGWVSGIIGEVSPFLHALLVDGIIGGVGAVVGFLPLVMVMYFLIAILEDCGYMARVAVVMDPILKKVGLSGKSIIPMVIGTGCAIPGVMASRTIKNETERRATAMLTPFMPCGAKLPVIALFAGAFFQDASWVGTLMYFVGIALIILGAYMIKIITGRKNAKSFFIIELPEYKLPSIWRATLSMLSRGKAFIIKAGTIILLCNAAVQIMQSFNWSFQLVAEGMENTSILASIASPIAFLFIPLGFGTWQLASAAVTGFIAKENVVGTLAVVFAITNFIDTEELALVTGAADVAAAMGLTSIAALSYLMFNLFTPPCFAAIGAMNSEMQSKKWLWAGIALQFSTAFVLSFLVYQIGTLVTAPALFQVVPFICGLVVTVALLSWLCILLKKGNAKSKLA